MTLNVLQHMPLPLSHQFPLAVPSFLSISPAPCILVGIKANVFSTMFSLFSTGLDRLSLGYIQPSCFSPSMPLTPPCPHVAESMLHAGQSTITEVMDCGGRQVVGSRLILSLTY